jgi:Ni/Fe-hydrogenase subunit HybB-like protein
MVTIEGTLAARAYGHKTETYIFSSLTKVTLWMLIVYLIVKFADLSYRGVLGMAFNGSFESNMFLLEMLAFVIYPIILYSIPAIRNTQWGVLTASLCVVVGVVFNRMNVVFTGMAKSAGGSYHPSPWEWLITMGLWSAMALLFLFIVENFPVLPIEKQAASVQISSTKGFATLVRQYSDNHAADAVPSRR